MKILKNLKEYFFRGSIEDYFDYERATKKELLSAENFYSYLEESIKAENICMFLARDGPFILEEAGLIASLLTSKFEYAVGGLIAGEHIRNLKLYYEILQVRKSKLKSAVRDLDNGSSLEENALQMSGHWGNGAYN